MTSLSFPRKIFHIITSTGVGGAENALLNLLRHSQTDDCETSVVSLTSKGIVGQEIERTIGHFYSLEMKPGFLDPGAIFRLWSILRKEQPDLVQTWMYHADLVGGIAARMAGKKPVVWGIRHSDLSLRWNKRSTLYVARLCAILSHWIPEKIIVCSQRAQTLHADIGYVASKMIYVPNGFDLDRFQPIKNARRILREELKLPEETPLIGLAARFHPMKDHQNFVLAAARILQESPGLHFLLCGKGVNWDNEQLSGWIRSLGIESHFHILGNRSDMPAIFSGLDIGCLSSISGEAFPNVVGEMMSCELPCVVTDVGDAADIVGQTGMVVPAGDPERLADAWSRFLNMTEEERSTLGKAARKRVIDHFSINQMVKRYRDVYTGVINRKG